MSEARLRTNIVKRLSGYAGWWVVTHGGQYQMGGLPDIIGCYKGYFYGLEVKLPGKEYTLTERQSYRLKQIRMAGGKAAMVTSVDQAFEFVFSNP
jgi:hypothetical protein